MKLTVFILIISSANFLKVIACEFCLNNKNYIYLLTFVVCCFGNTFLKLSSKERISLLGCLQTLSLIPLISVGYRDI